MSEQVLKEILGELKNVNQRLSQLEEGQGQVASKIDSLDTRVSGLETKVDRMEANQLKLETRIENEVIDKIRVLFDAHSLYMDYFTSIKDSQARIEENIGFITRRSTETFMKALENEREIRLLRVEKK